MSLSGLLTAAAADPALVAVRDGIGGADPDDQRPRGGAAVRDRRGRRRRPARCWPSPAPAARPRTSSPALRCLLPPDQVALYPGWETLPHERLSPRADTVGQRLAVLRRLAHPSADDPTAGPLSVVVAPVRSVLQPQVPGLGELVPVELHAGDDGRELTDIVTDLVAAGYARTELVEKRGDFAVRGGILDVFPPTEEHPLRVEFWGDEVEEIRYFKVADQRSLEIAEHGLWAPPCRELLLTARRAGARRRSCWPQHPELAELLDPISRGEAVEGMEALAPGARRRARARAATNCRPARTSSSATRSGCAPAPPTSSARRRSSSTRRGRSPPAAAQAPVDLGAASLRDLADVEVDRPQLGLPWWGVTARLRRDPDTVASAFRRGARPTAATPRPRSTDLQDVDARRLAGRARLRRARLGPARGRAAGRRRDRRPARRRRRPSSPASST